MRTEVKAGLIVGLIIIGGIVFYAVNRGGGGRQADKIPWDLTVDEAGGTDAGRVAAGPTDEPRRASSEQVPARRPSRSPTPAAEPVTTAPAGVGSPTSRPARGPLVTPTTQPAARGPLAGAPGVPIPRRPERTLRPETPKPKPGPIRYTIELGDTLYAVASAYYGEGRYWTKIRDANPDIDPDRLMEGQVILLPPKEDVLADAVKRPQTAPADRPLGTRPETYAVGTGDTLTSIAREILGDGSRWKEIYDLNRDTLDHPDLLHEGTELRLPAVKKKD